MDGGVHLITRVSKQQLDDYSALQELYNQAINRWPLDMGLVIERSRISTELGDFDAATADIGNESGRPVFIVGMPRSGTTLTEQILAAHPEVYAAGERTFWPEFQAELASHGRYLPAFLTKEFDEYPKCGRLEHGFLRVRCESCHDEKLVAFNCKKRGFWPLSIAPSLRT